MKVALNRMRDLVDVTRFPVLLKPIELSGSEWWIININELNGGCWYVYLKRVLLVWMLLGELLGWLF